MRISRLVPLVALLVVFALALWVPAAASENESSSSAGKTDLLPDLSSTTSDGAMDGITDTTTHNATTNQSKNETSNSSNDSSTKQKSTSETVIKDVIEDNAEVKQGAKPKPSPSESPKPKPFAPLGPGPAAPPGPGPAVSPQPSPRHAEVLPQFLPVTGQGDDSNQFGIVGIALAGIALATGGFALRRRTMRTNRVSEK